MYRDIWQRKAKCREGWRCLIKLKTVIAAPTDDHHSS